MKMLNSERYSATFETHIAFRNWINDLLEIDRTREHCGAVAKVEVTDLARSNVRYRT